MKNLHIKNSTQFDSHHIRNSVARDLHIAAAQHRH